MSSNTDVVMKNTNKGTHMVMYFVLRWTAQISVGRKAHVYACFFVHGIAQFPVGKPQNQAQIGLKRTRTGHQGICTM